MTNPHPDVPVHQLESYEISGRWLAVYTDAGIHHLLIDQLATTTLRYRDRQRPDHLHLWPVKGQPLTLTAPAVDDDSVTVLASALHRKLTMPAPANCIRGGAGGSDDWTRLVDPAAVPDRSN